ncbi:hypothetical protein NVIE_004720 [Nitrososphaera viennensis EN76]|uniref:Uncharacterized protein n=1 Tax=Nitrososphaera viennensis EN76 TaxID=926571 RepID=A0A060HGD7_9ARCH|nr:hypothetical protein NVIE_004720 [Nitrososphaera viennensis EN76]
MTKLFTTCVRPYGKLYSFSLLFYQIKHPRIITKLTFYDLLYGMIVIIDANRFKKRMPHISRRCQYNGAIKHKK